MASDMSKNPMISGCNDGGIKTPMNDTNIQMKNKPGIEGFSGTMNLSPSSGGGGTAGLGGAGGGTGSEIKGPGNRDSWKKSN